MLSLYFDPGLDPETKAELRQEFVIALDSVPNWATQRAFDEWVRDERRRPSPGDIVKLARKHLRPIYEEIARREKRTEEPNRERVTPEAAAAILQAAGFAPKRMGGAE